MDIIQELFKMQDKKYADFEAKLVPNVNRERIIGVRTPLLKSLAKEIYKSPFKNDFLGEKHYYHDENRLHGYILSLYTDYDESIKELEKFLPQITNWEVCDIIKPKSFNKNKDKLIEKIKEWINSDRDYTIRFGIEMLMNFFLDDDFSPEYLNYAIKVKSSDYYVQMMQAWYYATALSKKWEKCIPVIEQNRLPLFVHNKTIQKARESYRITDTQKEYLTSLKREK